MQRITQGIDFFNGLIIGGHLVASLEEGYEEYPHGSVVYGVQLT